MSMPHTVTLHDDETALSFGSRLAAVNQLPSLSELLKDFQFTITDLLNGDPTTLAGLAELGGVEATRLAHRAFRPLDSSSYQIAGSTVDKRHLNLRRNRICPACFRADLGGQMSASAMVNAYARVLWSFSSARTCPIHHLFLVAPPEEDLMYEFASSWSPWLLEVAEGELDEPSPAEARFEGHLSDRLAGSDEHGWLMEFQLGALGAACEMMGISLLLGKQAGIRDMTPRELAVATDVGFTLLADGPQAVVAYFETLRSEKGSPQDKPQARYGRIYEWMARGSGKGDAYAPLRDLFRQHILETWPLEAGVMVLGYRLPERRLHSIRTASQTHGLHPKRLRRLLTDAGLLAESDRPDFDTLFSAPAAQTFLEQASGSVDYAEAQRRLGMTRTQMEMLIADGQLKPGEGGDRARPRFTDATINEWTDFFNSFPSAPQRHTLTSVTETVSSRGITTSDVLNLITQQQLREVFRDSRKRGLSAILIRKSEVAQHLKAVQGRRLSTSISAASRDAGISTDFLQQLANAGCFSLVQATEIRSHHQPETRIPDDELAQFNAQYVSRRYLSRSGRSPLAIKRKINDAGI
ncbi:TniQ family protein [Pararhodobacter oceanensis]|uniref:TniQ family protein n=1 Tax=Pararhodobacter oceanensis TaxID=2172121 RepID=UPI003A93D604